MSKKDPKIAILGYGRSGKDTVGAWLGLHTRLRYCGSTSQVVCPFIAKELGISEKEAWESRHNNRMFWYNWCNEYRKHDPARIAKDCLSVGDMVVGLRDIIELEACVKEGLFDLTLWIDRPVPPDATVTFPRSMCDIVIDNTGTLDELYYRLDRLARCAGWMKDSSI